MPPGDLASSTFAATRWTRVVEARGDSPDARAALSDLCEAYYSPVVAFIRRQRGDADEARDLAHEFFQRILGGMSLAGADPERGRFRSFLLGAVKHFLADHTDHQQRQKRGGGITPESLDAMATTENGSAPGIVAADAQAIPPDVLFDRQWAITVLDRAMKSIEIEMAAQGQARQLEVLKPWLLGQAEHGAQSQAAAELGMNETAIRVAVYRLRQRFRQAVRAELGQTMSPGCSIDEELQTLRQALAFS